MSARTHPWEETGPPARGLWSQERSITKVEPMIEPCSTSLVQPPGSPQPGADGRPLLGLVVMDGPACRAVVGKR